MSYRELGENVARFAGVLRRRGVKRGDVIGFKTHPELETVLILSTLQLGATSLSISSQVLEGYRQHINQVISPDEQFMRELGMVQPVTQPEPLASDDVVRVSFSSGTTGMPKGIPFSVSTLLPRTESVRKNWLVEDPFMSLLGLETVTGILAYYWSIFNGMPFFINTNAKLNLELIANHKVRSIQTSPAKLKDLIFEQQRQNLELELEHVYTAGSMATPSLVKLATEVLGCQVFSVYGSTEVGSASIGPFDEEELNSLGRLVFDVDLQIVDEELEVLPPGSIGEIRYRKPAMPTEYWFGQSVAKNGFSNGWFYPGDRGKVTESGVLILEGRNDDLVNSGGSKFNLAQLDLWLADSGLFEDVASFTETDQTGETLIGIVFVSDQKPDPETLISSLKNFLPTLKLSKMFAVDAIPRNKMDKVDRVAIQQLIQENRA